jgi:hypothetical protein
MAAAPTSGMRVITLGILALAAMAACRSRPRESVGTTTTTSAGLELEATGRVASAELPPEAGPPTHETTSAELPPEAGPSSPYYSIVAAPNLADNLGIAEAGAPSAAPGPGTEAAPASPDGGSRAPSAADAVPWSGRR